MSVLAVPSASQKPTSRERASTWAQPPTLTFTLDSDSGSDPYNIDVDSEAEQESSCLAGVGGSSVDTPTSVPRGHHLAWTIPSRIVQTPSIPAFSQISFSLSTLSFSRSPRSEHSASSLLSSSPSTPTALSSSGVGFDQSETPSEPAPPSQFLRAPSCYSPDTTCDWNLNNTSSTNRIRAHSFSTTPTPLQAPGRISPLTTTTALFTSMSRPSWDPSPLLASTSSLSHSHGNTTTGSIAASPSTTSTTAPKSITSYPNPISIEDARLLDPSYLSSVPIPFHNLSHGLCAGGSSAIGGALYSHAIPYVDPQGTLHDPDYRPFPLIRQTKRSSPSPFAIRKPYWEMDYEDEIDSDHNDGYDTDASTSSTPTSTTPFICYFVETHPLKRRGNSLHRKNKNHNALKISPNYSTDARAGRGIKLNTSYMYTTIATGLGVGGPGGHTPAPAYFNASLIPQYAATLSNCPPAMEGVSHNGREKEKKSWGGLLWKSNGRKQGIE